MSIEQQDFDSIWRGYHLRHVRFDCFDDVHDQQTTPASPLCLFYPYVFRSVSCSLLDLGTNNWLQYQRWSQECCVISLQSEASRPLPASANLNFNLNFNLNSHGPFKFNFFDFESSISTFPLPEVTSTPSNCDQNVYYYYIIGSRQLCCYTTRFNCECLIRSLFLFYRVNSGRLGGDCLQVVVRMYVNLKLARLSGDPMVSSDALANTRK